MAVVSSATSSNPQKEYAGTAVKLRKPNAAAFINRLMVCSGHNGDAVIHVENSSSEIWYLCFIVPKPVEKVRKLILLRGGEILGHRVVVTPVSPAVEC